MVSVERWKEHFKRMAHKSFPHEDMYIVNQVGRGLGRNAYQTTTYKIRNPAKNTGPNPAVQIVSPVGQDVERAKALIDEKPIKKKKTKKKTSKKAGSGGAGSKGKKKPKKDKDKKKKKKKTTTTTTKKKQ